jgi:hypothetical protein
MCLFVTRTLGVTGTLCTNGKSRDNRIFHKLCCYITQEDLIQPLLTVQEIMMVAARLKLPSDTSEKSRLNTVIDSRLLVVMGRDFVSALRPVACCTIPGWKRMRPSERARSARATPNLTTRDLWRSRKWARKWEFCPFVPVGLQEFFYMP